MRAPPLRESLHCCEVEARLTFGNSKQLSITLALRSFRPTVTDQRRVERHATFIWTRGGVYFGTRGDRPNEVTRKLRGVNPVV
jgi:hypothetical protein